MATTQANSAIWIDDDESNFISLDRDENLGISNIKRNVFVRSAHSRNDYEIQRLFNDLSGSKSVCLSDSVSVLSLSPSQSDDNVVMDMEDSSYYEYMEDMMDVSSASSRTSEMFRPTTTQSNEDIVDVNNAASNSCDMFSLTTSKSNEHLVVPQFRLKKDPYLEAVVVRLPLDTQTKQHETSDDRLDDITENFHDLSTKDKLKLNIIRKRIAEGKDIEEFLQQCQESSKIEVMPSEEEKAKEFKRKERNRLSAKKSRDSKKEEYVRIKKQHKVLVQVNEEKKKDIEDLAKKAKTLEDYIHTFELQPLVEKTAVPSEELFNTHKLEPSVEKIVILSEEFINTHNLHPHINQESVSEHTLETDYPTSHCPSENVISYSGQDISLNETESLNNKVLLETLLQCCPELRQRLQTSCQLELSENLLADSMELDSCAETNSFQVQVMENTQQTGEGVYYNQNDWCGETIEQYNSLPDMVSLSELCVDGPALQSTNGLSDTQTIMVTTFEQYNSRPDTLSTYQYSNTQPALLFTQQQPNTQTPALLSSQQQCGTQPPSPMSSQQQCHTQPAAPLSSPHQCGTQPAAPLSSPHQCGTQPPAPLSSQQQCYTQPPAPLSSLHQCGTQPPVPMSSQQQSDTVPSASLSTHQQCNKQPALLSMHSSIRIMSDSLKSLGQNPQFPSISSQTNIELAQQNVMHKTDTQQEYTAKRTSRHSNDSNQIKIISTKKVLDPWQVDFSSSSDEELKSLTSSFI